MLPANERYLKPPSEIGTKVINKPMAITIEITIVKILAVLFLCG